MVKVNVKNGTLDQKEICLLYTSIWYDIINNRQEFANMAQSAEHILGKDEVVRSNRISSSMEKARNLAIPSHFPGFFIFLKMEKCG